MNFEYDQRSSLGEEDLLEFEGDLFGLLLREFLDGGEEDRLDRLQAFLDNVNSCASALLDKFSSPDELDESLQMVSGRAYLLASICVCAEQTVAQASATQKIFARAFSIALDAYVKSTVRDKAKEAIKVLFEGRDWADDFLLKGLGDIIKNHRLRIDVDTA